MRASRIWHAVLALVVLVAMIVQLVLVFNGGTDVNAVTTEGDAGLGTRLIRLFSYFTIRKGTGRSAASCASTPCSASW
jgi:hypothetical protein